MADLLFRSIKGDLRYLIAPEAGAESNRATAPKIDRQLPLPDLLASL